VRLVVYESQSRAPATVHNEKAICSIGRDMVTTGRLHAEGMKMALETLARFKILADGLQVTIRDAAATAAARDAENGQDFIRKAEAAWGAPIRVLSGEEEARLAAEGVLAGIPDADGVAADLGGGSLDMVSVKNGRMSEAHTLPFGPLRLMDLAKGSANKARDIVDEGLEEIPGLRALEGRSLYAVGGIWRSVARVDMDQHSYPLHVLQHYEIPRSRALRPRSRCPRRCGGRYAGPRRRRPRSPSSGHASPGAMDRGRWPESRGPRGAARRRGRRRAGSRNGR